MRELDFTSENELEEWLRDKPVDWSQAIAARAALRVFPLVLDILPVSDSLIQEDLKEQLILEVFRGNFISWAALKYPAKDMRGAARRAANPIDIANAAAYAAADNAERAANAAAYAAAARAAGTADSVISAANTAAFGTVTDAATAVDNAARAARATDAANAAGAMVRQAVSVDSHWPLMNGESARLIDLPLWLDDIRGDQSYRTNIPEWARTPLDAFAADEEWGARDPWRVIVHWYHGLLPGGGGDQVRDFFGEEATIKIATQPDWFWTVSNDRSVEDILFDIQAIRAGDPQKYQGLAKGTDAKASAKNVEEPKGSTGGDGTDAGLPFDRDDPLRGGADKKTSAPDNPTAVTTQFDHPTADDDLGRRPFAQALVKRLDEMLESGGRDGLAVNLHAPWGAGKTSVLLMMEEALSKPNRDGGPWAVVAFNAWDYESRKPPWWPLIETVNTCCQKSLQSFGRTVDANWLRLEWYGWRALSNVVPIVLCLAVFGLLMFWLVVGGANEDGEAAKGLSIDTFLKTLLSAAGAFAAFVAAGRALVFGSADNAKFHFTLARDPLKRVKKLFRNIIDATDVPVCIFIDDLDRCDADFVVDLLEGIQTSFRHPKVAYVVAADKTWIRSSFESRYQKFEDQIGDAGQPLGYLFLEKIFQFSVAVPGMGAWKKRYFDKLLKGDEETAVAANLSEMSPADPAEKNRIFDAQVQEKREDIQKRHGKNISREGMRNELQDVSDDKITRAALVLEYADSELAHKETEHLLARFVDQLPENPRVMKRLINAFGMRLSNDLLEETNAPDEVIARWTILEQRFPSLADLLIKQPEWADKLASPDVSEDVPKVFASFWKSQPVQNILAGPIRSEDGRDQKADALALDADNIRLITRGASD